MLRYCYSATVGYRGGSAPHHAKRVHIQPPLWLDAAAKGRQEAQDSLSSFANLSGPRRGGRASGLPTRCRHQKAGPTVSQTVAAGGVVVDPTHIFPQMAAFGRCWELHGKPNHANQPCKPRARSHPSPGPLDACEPGAIHDSGRDGEMAWRRMGGVVAGCRLKGRPPRSRPIPHFSRPGLENSDQWFAVVCINLGAFWNSPIHGRLICEGATHG